MPRWLRMFLECLTFDGPREWSNKTRMDQRGNQTGGIITTGDLVQGNYSLSGRSAYDIPEGTYVGGDLKISCKGFVVSDLPPMVVKGRVIINGINCTEDFKAR